MRKMASGSRGLFEEFIVDTEQVSQITRAKSKIERMHEVRIKLKEEAKLDASSKRWIRVEGDVRDRMNARVRLYTFVSYQQHTYFYMAHGTNL